MRRLAVRIVIAITVLAGALLLLLPNSTGAEFFQTRTVNTGSLTSATVAMTTGAGAASGTSGTTIVVDPSSGYGYSDVDLSLVNTGNGQTRALAFTVDGVAVTNVSGTGLATNLAIVWALAGSATDCSTVSYTGANVVWSSTTVSMSGSTPAALSASAQSIAYNASTKLCARYKMGSGTSSSGDQINVTYSFIGWNAPTGSFTSVPVTWKQSVTLSLPAPTPATTFCSYNYPNVTLDWTWSGSSSVSFVTTSSGPSNPGNTVTGGGTATTLSLGGLVALGGGTWTFSTVAVSGTVRSDPMVIRLVINLFGGFNSCKVIS